MLPQALKLGITYDEFWRMNPRLLDIYGKVYRDKLEDKDREMWILGSYFRDALISTVGNMFKSKGSKTIEYPKTPYMQSEEFKRLNNNQELTEEEKIEQTKILFGQLQIMQSNFELSHKE